MNASFGQYELLRTLASGGMGRVFLARSTGPEGFQKLLVLKTVLGHYAGDPEFVAMFLDEARLAARLNHPNICQIFDLGQLDGTYYLAMEYVPGVDLRNLVRDLVNHGKALPVHLACRIVADAAAGLHYAHGLADDDGNTFGLVHRDVSPSNVLVGYDGGVKLIDFGIAKASGRLVMTGSGQLKGKIAYMSPEQAAGEAIDRRSDIFSLGLVLHELITGTRAFQRDTETATLRAVQECAVPPPSQQAPGIPASLDAVVMKALARSADDRYATARDFQLALEEWVLQHGQPASQVHLSAFMHDAYGERVELDKTPRRSKSMEFPLDDTIVPGSGSVSGPRSQPSAGKRTNRMPQVGGDEEERPSRRRFVRLGALVGVFVALIIAVAGTLQVTVNITPKSGATAEAAPSPAATPQRARLWLTTDPPGAQVTLDGALIGKTPIVDADIPRKPGTKLSLSGEGLVTRELALPDSEEHRLAVTLERAAVEVTLSSEPSGAEVLDAQQRPIGVTPAKWIARPGEKATLTFRLKNRSVVREVEAAAGAEVNVRFTSGGAKKEPPPDEEESPFKFRDQR